MSLIIRSIMGLIILIASFGCRPKVKVTFVSSSPAALELLSVDTPCAISGAYSDALVHKESTTNSLALVGDSLIPSSDQPYLDYLSAQIEKAENFPKGLVHIVVDPQVDRFGTNFVHRRFVVTFTIKGSDGTDFPLLGGFTVADKAQSKIAVVVSKGDGESNFTSSLGLVKFSIGASTPIKYLNKDNSGENRIADWIGQGYAKYVEDEAGDDPSPTRQIDLKILANETEKAKHRYAYLRENPTGQAQLVVAWLFTFTDPLANKKFGSLFQAKIISNPEHPDQPDIQVSKADTSLAEAEGQARVLLDNKDKEPTLVSISNMQTSGYLCSASFGVHMDKGDAYVRSPKLLFSFPKNAPEYEQVAAFTHVSSMYEYFTKRGATNWSGTQIVLDFTDDPYWFRQGPQYQNPSIRNGEGFDVTRPTIRLPAAMRDGAKSKGENVFSALQNLRTDSDAISHELVHHFLYQYVGLSFDSEHMALVEGIPDALVMLKTKDPCLGETICVKDGSICVDNQCLRRADNNFVYGKEPYDSITAFHKMSQLISGFVWSLRVEHNFDFDYLGDLLFNTMRFMQNQTGYRDFIQSVMNAEKAINNKKNACAIYQTAKNRGLDLLGSFDCNNY